MGGRELIANAKTPPSTNVDTNANRECQRYNLDLLKRGEGKWKGGRKVKGMERGREGRRGRGKGKGKGKEERERERETETETLAPIKVDLLTAT